MDAKPLLKRVRTVVTSCIPIQAQAGLKTESVNDERGADKAERTNHTANQAAFNNHHITITADG